MSNIFFLSLISKLPKSQIANFFNMFSTRVLCKYLIFLLFILSVFLPISGQAGIVDTSEYANSGPKDSINFNLLIAASKGDDSETERLLRTGADIHTTSNEGATPLVYAIANGHLSTVRILIASDPDINRKTRNFETPLIIAVKGQNLEITELLIRNGADIDLTDRNGATPLHYTALLGSFYIADMLLYYNADIDKKSNDGTTPLMAAVLSGYADVADLLIQNGSNLEARDKGGFTPFLIAAQNGDTLLMDLLLKKGVNLYEKTINNYNALSLAITSNRKEAVEFLLEKGDKWTSGDNAGINPYVVSINYDSKDFVKILKKKNISGNPPRKLSEAAVWAGEKFNIRDLYTGISFSLKEPLSDAGIIAGFDTKLWYTRVLIKTGENLFYQFYDKSSIIYAGLFRDFTIARNGSGTHLFLSPVITGAYSFAHMFKGTNDVPANKFKLIPSAIIKVQKNKFIVTAGIEYMKPELYKISPVWLRAGLTYRIYSEKINSPDKVIKWR
jgi:ankyrin repeat protein